MLFTLDETQQAVVGVTADALARGDHAAVVGLGVPARLGGDGLGPLEVLLALREVGRAGVMVPAYPTLALGVLPVVAWGTEEQQEKFLDGSVLTAALREPSAPAPAAPRTVAGPDLAVTGTKVGVPYAEEASRVLVPVSLTGGGTAVAVVDPRAPGVTLTRTHTSSGTPEYTLRLDGVVADGLLGDGPVGGPVDGIYQLAAAGACAVGTGAVAGALALTTTHIGRREQFGRPLATFQAVAQQIADVYVAARTLELALVSAAWRLGTGLPAAEDVAVAAYWLAAEAPAALRTCHHLHGGLGLDVSYPLHRYSALIGDLVRAVGGSEHCLELVGDSCSST